MSWILKAVFDLWVLSKNNKKLREIRFSFMLGLQNRKTDEEGWELRSSAEFHTTYVLYLIKNNKIWWEIARKKIDRSNAITYGEKPNFLSSLNHKIVRKNEK